MNKILIIAHRGVSGLARENTLESFAKAIELGVPMVELDVRKTQDDFYVCYHDEAISGINLTDINYTKLLELSHKQGFKVPQLEEVLSLGQGQTKLDIELKEVGYEKEIVKLVNKYFNYSDYVIKSFHDTSIKTIKTIDKNITTGLLLGINQPKNLILTRLLELFPEYRLLQTKADFVSPNYRLLKLGFCWRMKFIKRNIYVWTVNDKDLMIKLAKHKVFALITDRPDLALNLFKNSSSASKWESQNRPGA